MSTWVSRETLRLRQPKDTPSRNVRPQDGGVAIHWGGERLTIDEHADCVSTWRGWQGYHMDVKDWNDIAYSWGVCDHGYILTGRGWGVRTAANGTDDANDRYLAVCWIGGPGRTPTALAFAAFEEVIIYCRDRGAGRSVRPHRALYGTSCPGDVLASAADHWNGRDLTGGSAPAHGAVDGAQPLPPAFPLPAGWYFGPEEGPRESVSGYHGRGEGLKVWQRKVGISADGLYGPRTHAAAVAVQRQHGLTRDGLIGVRTWAATWA